MPVTPHGCVTWLTDPPPRLSRPNLPPVIRCLTDVVTPSLTGYLSRHVRASNDEYSRGTLNEAR